VAAALVKVVVTPFCTSKGRLFRDLVAWVPDSYLPMRWTGPWTLDGAERRRQQARREVRPGSDGAPAGRVARPDQEYSLNHFVLR